MIVTYNWLKEFVDFDLTPAELGHLLTMLGLEVEGMECRGEGLDDVVVALVEEKAQHPNADKLSLCRVNNGREVFSIVCGAQNFKAGDKVPTDNFEITLQALKRRGDDFFCALTFPVRDSHASFVVGGWAGTLGISQRAAVEALSSVSSR